MSPPEASATMHRDARGLVSALRGATVAVLHGGTADDRSRVLNAELLPLLARRPLDHPANGTRPRRALQAPQRRLPLMRRKPADRNEVVLVLSDWAAEPLPHLDRSVRRACSLAPAASDLRADAAVGLRVLLVLQDFDAFLALDAERADVAAFRTELLRCAATATRSASATWPAANGADADTPVHLLLLVQALSAPALVELGPQLPGFGAHTLGLITPEEPPPGPAVEPSATAAPAAAAQGPPPTDSTQPQAIVGGPAVRPASDEDWLASLQGVIERVAASSREPQPEPGAPASPIRCQTEPLQRRHLP